jgi:hypothetical protein
VSLGFVIVAGVRILLGVAKGMVVRKHKCLCTGAAIRCERSQTRCLTAAEQAHKVVTLGNWVYFDSDYATHFRSSFFS